MSAFTIRRATYLMALLAASCASRDASSDAVSERWRQWFEHREFGEDPYFFFPQGETGPTGCPAHQRLSYAGGDSVGVRLEVLDERGITPQVRARCTVRFTELEGVPSIGKLPDGRAMWALRAVRVVREEKSRYR